MNTPKILLVESDPLLGEVTAFRLELLGYQVRRADSSSAALAQVEQDRPDLIIVDLQLADASGFDITEHLRNDERTSKVPIMALSSSADLDDVQRAFQCGAQEYLVVPFNPAVLEQKVTKVLAAT